uniref:Outer membrane protein H n=1 Tax=uncultured Thiotrichaceae bacterium TaxID=298394 RepID=A0A6S6SB90_9GAMM|nr:MAG: Unknown protein [uncultured Thiotrichaceae bacterium]
MNKLYNLALGHLSKHIRTSWLASFGSALLASLLFWNAVDSVQADTSDGQYRFAVVKMSVILNQSPQAEAASDTLRQRYVMREEALATEQVAIQQAEENFRQKQRATPADELAKLESQLRIRQRNLKRNREDLREEVRVAKDQALSDLKKNVSFAIEAIRQQEQIDIIFRESDYLVSSKRVDITTKVLAYLHEQFNDQNESPESDATSKED